MSTVVHDTPLSGCLASLVAQTPSQLRALETLTLRTGFSDVCSEKDGLAFPARGDPRLAYFLFHYEISPELLRHAIGAIRADGRFRFNPAVVVVGECSETEALRYINLGFDDILLLPQSARVIERRLSRQLGTPVSYFETDTYFGPDRRRANVLSAAQRDLRTPGRHRHVRYLIQRSGHGVDVLRREVVVSTTPTNEPAAELSLA